MQQHKNNLFGASKCYIFLTLFIPRDMNRFKKIIYPEGLHYKHQERSE